jgi:PAS domain S-box-containing protein
MRMFNIRELIDIDSFKKIAENIYEIAGIGIAIADLDGTVDISIGMTDICRKYHKSNPITSRKCLISERYVHKYIGSDEYIEYKCLNNIRDIAIPIVISGKHIGTVFFGQFFYDDEEIDIECYRAQALKYGFNEKDYLEALSRVPIFSRSKVKHIIEYYKGLVGILVESGLKQLELENSKRKFEKSQKYLDEIFNSINDSILICDTDGNIIDVNQAALNMLEYNRKELIGMNVYDVVSTNSSNCEINKEDGLNKIRKSNPFICEEIYKTKRGNECWCESNLRIANINGEERVIAVMRNISERKQNELRLHNEALELEKLRTEFFANISHELRTPLNIILGTNKIIKMNIEKENIDRKKIARNIDIEKQNCLRLLRLINNLIDSTKLDSGYFELNMVNCNVVNIVEEITLSVADYISSNNLTVTFDTEIEEKIIACDLDKIERIMFNIISNAIKFSRPGGNIFVNIYDGEEFITISIEDNGIGIKDDKLNIIFDRFRQVDKSFTRSNEGSGIGLSLAKSLVEMQGGRISVESKYGVGTKFFIRLPVKLVDDSKHEENVRLLDNKLNSYVEKIKIEFSDIYSL